VVELDNPISVGHSMDGHGRTGCCVNIPVDELIPINTPTRVVPLPYETNIKSSQLQLLVGSGIDIDYFQKCQLINLNMECGGDTNAF
jgi:hypothetical protein